MLSKLLGRLLSQGRGRPWTETEIRELLERKAFDEALDVLPRLHRDTPQRELVLDCLRAEVAFHRRQDAEALDLYLSVLKRAPGFADAHYGLSLLLYSQGDVNAAVQHAIFARNLDPLDTRYAAQLGLCYIALDNHAQAEELLLRVVRHNPEDKFSWNNLGIVLLYKGSIEEAQRCFHKALQIDPEFELPKDNLEKLEQNIRWVEPEGLAPVDSSVTQAQVETFEAQDGTQTYPWEPEWEAVTALQRTHPRDKVIAAAEALFLRQADDGALCARLERFYQLQGDPESALAHALAFHERHPDDRLGLWALGNALSEMERHKEAEPHFRKALELGPVTGKLLRALGRCLTKQEKHQEALEVYREYEQRYPSHIGTAFLAAAGSSACDYDTALACFEQLERDGNLQRHNLSLVHAATLMFTGRLDDAYAIVSEALERLPNSPALRSIRAQIHLMRGDFAAGWDDYEFRNLNYSKFFRTLPFAEWSGQALDGQRIVVLAEQGLGDQVMFAQCLDNLQALRPARLVVEVMDRVAPTIARSFPDCEVIATAQDKRMDWLKEAGDFDYFVPLGSLPRHFRREPADFPRKPYLRADPQRVLFWQEKLRRLGPGPHVGITWRGGTEHTRKAVRSLSTTAFQPLVSAGKGQWIALQYGDIGPDLQQARDAGMALHYWPEAIRDLDEFAALISALDLVITVCNTTVHYAGALGTTTWVLAPQTPEWRYGISAPSMPWYANVQVFRQNRLGDWVGLIDQIRQKLSDNF